MSLSSSFGVARIGLSTGFVNMYLVAQTPSPADRFCCCPTWLDRSSLPKSLSYSETGKSSLAVATQTAPGPHTCSMDTASPSSGPSGKTK